MNTRMTYPLAERIGEPRLLVGREKEFAEYHRWIAGIPRRISKSRAIIARKKSGKSAFVQRLFNQLWAAHGSVIPFYFEVREAKVWLPSLATNYFETFASQFIAFRERDPSLVMNPWDIAKIRAYAETNGLDTLVQHADAIDRLFRDGLYDAMWVQAISAPHRLAVEYGTSILVIVDEFQNLSGFVYTDQKKTIVDESIPGTYHELSESKAAPMLATGSAVGWLVQVIDRYLEGGRLSKLFFSPYLTEDEGLAAVYRYAEIYEEPITNETALLLNELCRNDPYFIACVMRSHCPERNLATREGVMRAVDFELESDYSELAAGWTAWFDNAISRINERHAKRMLLYLSRHPGKVFTPQSLRAAMKLDLGEDEIASRLLKLREADLLGGQFSDRFFGLEDGTFFLLIQKRMGDQLRDLDPEADQGIDYLVEKLTSEKRALQNRLNQVSGRLAEAQLEIDMRTRKSFETSVYFEGMSSDPTIEIAAVYPRYLVQGPDGKQGEVDLRVDSPDGYSLLVEVKKTQKPSTEAQIRSFAAKVALFEAQNPDRSVLAGFLSLGGFTDTAEALCRELNIGTATSINYLHKEWQ